MFTPSGLTLLFRLAEAVSVFRAGRALIFQREGMEPLHVPVQTEGLAQGLLALTGPGISWQDLTLIAARDGGPGILEDLDGSLAMLCGMQMLALVWYSGGLERAAITSFSPSFRFSEIPLCQDFDVILSRFAYVRRDGGRTVLESPEALCRLEFKCLQTWYLLGLLWQPTSIGVAMRTGQHGLVELAAFLWSTGFLERSDMAERSDRTTWEFHDLLFHWRTRGGRVTGPQGGTFRFLEKLSPPPAIKSPMSEETIALPVPVDAPTEDSNLVTVIERRRSVRDQGELPISLQQISRLLYYTVRVQDRLPGDHEELLLRPVPAAGAIHEIEVYLAVGQCSGLQRGLYHYQPMAHQLSRIEVPNSVLAALLDDAALSWAKPDEPPQVLLILTSRFQRLAWKYEGIAYRLTLLNAGVIIQSLYLLATEMGLACSAIGGGDSEVFAVATGLDPLVETSIAEFALGSIADEAWSMTLKDA